MTSIWFFLLYPFVSRFVSLGRSFSAFLTQAEGTDAGLLGRLRDRLRSTETWGGVGYSLKMFETTGQSGTHSSTSCWDGATRPVAFSGLDQICHLYSFVRSVQRGVERIKETWGSPSQSTRKALDAMIIWVWPQKCIVFTKNTCSVCGWFVSQVWDLVALTNSPGSLPSSCGKREGPTGRWKGPKRTGGC